jgi:hypothetical protein
MWRGFRPRHDCAFLFAVLCRVVLAGFLFVILREYELAMGDERVVSRLFVVAGVVALGRVAMLLGCELKVLCCHKEMFSTCVFY